MNIFLTVKKELRVDVVFGVQPVKWILLYLQTFGHENKNK